MSEGQSIVFHADGTSTVESSAYDDDSSDAEFILARVSGGGTTGAEKTPATPTSPSATSAPRFGAGLIAGGLALAKFARLGSGSSAPATAASAVVGVADDSATGTGDDIDWDFWGRVMNNYDDVARKQPKVLTKKLQKGIPEAIRGSVWQFMCKGKSDEMETTYRALLLRTSTHEKVIQRDLARTFPNHDHFRDANGPGQESLFNVLKAYSVYDPEVGYCQGIAFITGPLLLNMPDEEAFCVLEKLMKSYSFRELYTPTMVGLHLRLFQFDKLLKELFPAISKHLDEHDVKSTMYASQWFMTLFAYRFPLPIVLRIMDILFAQGIESTFKIAFALLKKNQSHLLTLTDLADLLEFLKNGLFDVYVDNVDLLIQDAAGIHISKSKMDRLAAEFELQLAKTHPELLSADALKGENRRLATSLKKLEEQYEALNREHIILARTHLEVQDVKERALQKAEENEVMLAGLKNVLSSERKEAEAQVKEEMDRLAQKNFELTKRNGDLEDQVDRLEALVRAQEKRLKELEITVNVLRGN